jgi:hypothetical protein
MCVERIQEGEGWKLLYRLLYASKLSDDKVVVPVNLQMLFRCARGAVSVSVSVLYTLVCSPCT